MTRLALSAVFILLATSGAAQEQTGGLIGTVRDTSGGVLPGATIEARSPAVVGVTTAVTNAEGQFRLPTLAPGTYVVTATLAGFETGTAENVEVAVGLVLKVDFTLPVAAVAETVDVVAKSSILDVTQSASFTTVNREALEGLALGLDFTRVISVAAGAQSEVRAGGMQIDGASGAENRFIIDGMDTTSLRYGTSGKPMLVDFLQELQVKSSGYAAEFGGATGGVINVITKSGSNSVRGTGGVYYQDDSFIGRPRPGRGYSPWDSNKPLSGLVPFEPSWQYVNPVGDIGGPLVTDRLWYYAGVSYAKNRYEENAIFIPDPSRANRHFDWSTFDFSPMFNVAAQLAPAVRLRVSGSTQRTGERKTAPGGPGYAGGMYPVNLLYDGPDPSLAGKLMGGYSPVPIPLNPDGTLDQAAYDRQWNKYGTDTSNNMLSGNVDWIVSPQMLINATLGVHRSNNWTSPDMRGNATVHVFNGTNADATMIKNGYPTVPLAYQQIGGYRDRISTNGTLRDIFTRAYINTSVTRYAKFHGEHALKAGMRVELSGNDVFTGDTKPRVFLSWAATSFDDYGNIATGKYGTYTVVQTGTAGVARSTNLAFWLQDAWSIGAKLTLNAGLRTENEHLPSYRSDVPGIDFGFAEKLAPRVGFAYDVRGNDRTKVYGSFGYFFDVMKLEEARTGALLNQSSIWTLDTYDWASIDCAPMGTCPGTLISRSDVINSYNTANDILAAYFNRPGMTSIDPAMKPYKTGEFTSGIDQQIGPTTSLGVRYVHKWLVRTVEDVGVVVPNQGVVYLLGNPGFGYATVLNTSYPQYPLPKAQRRYDGLEFRLRKRLANRWSAEVDYTYSRLWGNYSGLASSDEGYNTGSARIAPNISVYFDTLYQSYDSSQHQVLGRLATDRPHVFKFWLTHQLPWGTSLGLLGIAESGLLQSSVIRWTGGSPVFFDGRGDLGRLPWYKQLNLQVEHAFSLSHNQRVSLQANVSNLFDLKTVTGYYAGSYGTSPWRNVVNGGDAVFFGKPWNPADVVAALRARGAVIRDDVWYKAPDWYQPRREIRLNVRYQF
jgi:hypothetical protein